MNVTERFLKYVAFDTQSDEHSESCPSSAKQKLLGAALVEEMKAIGVADARMDEWGYVYGSVPGTAEGPVIGLIAALFWFKKRFILTDEKVAELAEEVKARRAEG